LERRLAGLRVDWQEATGQDRLLDSRLQDPPLETIGRLAMWLSDTLDAPPASVIPAISGAAEVARTPGGKPVLERTVRLGPVALFGIITEGESSPEAPTVVLVNEGNTHHIGQARIWVDLARQLGAAGLRVLRFDLSGNGDSGVRPGQEAHVVRAPEATDDVLEAMRAVSPEDPSDVVLVGFCSGAYQVLETALRTPPRGICIVNPSVSFVPPERNGSHPRPARQVTKRWFVSLVHPPMNWIARRRRPGEMDRWMKALEIGTWPVALATRSASIPKPVWWLVYRVLLENTGIETLRKVASAGVATLVVCGPRDFLPISLGSGGRMHALQQSANFRFVLMEDFDHSSWVMDQRKRLISELADDLVAAYGTSPSGAGHSVQLGSTL
jgi:pimeloyl-ACP methyl ester carboxylesterase